MNIFVGLTMLMPIRKIEHYNNLFFEIFPIFLLTFSLFAANEIQCQFGQSLNIFFNSLFDNKAKLVNQNKFIIYFCFSFNTIFKKNQDRNILLFKREKNVKERLAKIEFLIYVQLLKNAKQFKVGRIREFLLQQELYESTQFRFLMPIDSNAFYSSKLERKF